MEILLNPAVATQVGINGLSLSAIYILMALGFTLIFGVMRVINFAHGEFYMLGAYATFSFAVFRGFNYFVALIIAAITVGLVSLVMERLVFRPFYGKELQGMIASMGLGVALQHLTIIIWGAQERALKSPLPAIIQVGNAYLPGDRVLIIIMSALILAGFYIIFKHTKAGLAMRAVAQDRQAGEAQGMRSRVIFTVAFLLASVLAALAGGLVGQVYALSPFMGENALLKAFIVVVLGGLGTVPGAVLGGFLLGMGESVVSTMYGATVSEMVSFLALIVLLLWRPWGLLGQPEN